MTRVRTTVEDLISGLAEALAGLHVTFEDGPTIWAETGGSTPEPVLTRDAASASLFDFLACLLDDRTGEDQPAATSGQPPGVFTARTIAEQAGLDPCDPADAAEIVATMVGEGIPLGVAQAAVRPFGSVVVCGRDECVAKAISYIAGRTNETATYVPDDQQKR